MPTTHTWNGTSKGAGGATPNIYNDAYYTDGQPFQPGDTLIVNSGSVGLSSGNGAVLPMRTGTYIFNKPIAGEEIGTSNLALDAASTMAFNGPGTLGWLLDDQFVNNGAMQFGSPSSSSGTVTATLNYTSTSPATVTNNGSITIQGNTLFKLEPSSGVDNFVNNAGATVNVLDEGGFTLSSVEGYGVGDDGDVTNSGLIAVTGDASGMLGGVNVQGSYQGSGLLSVRGVPGYNYADLVATIAGPASGIFDAASAHLKFGVGASSGAVNFLDNNVQLQLDDSLPDQFTGTGSLGKAFGAAISGFQAGDVIYLNGNLSGATTLTYAPSTHLLTVSYAGGTLINQFTMMGNYQQSDFQLVPVGGGYQGLEVATTSTANAITPFAVQDVTTGAVAASPGQQYTGPVNYLQSQYTWTSADKVNVTTGLPDVYLVGGAGDDALAANSGSNVLDGGLGSNFLTGATGADGGQDTFFLDGSKGVTWDTIVNFHPGDSVTLWGFVPGTSSDTWAASDGAANYQGATIHAAFAGAGTPTNGSVTFTGISQATQQAHFSVTSGSSGGRDYLNIHYNR